MARSAGPLIPRRRFGSEIKRLRDARGETLADTASALLISTSKLSRIENGQGELRPRDVRDLLAHFEVGSDDDGSRLREWAKQARVPGWWQAGAYRMPPQLDTFISFENAATRIEDYSPVVVPGWLQTRRYAAGTLERLAPALDDDQRAEQIDLRLQRQDALRSRIDPPELFLVVPETILRRVVGSEQVMREQLDALVAAYDDPRIDLHVIPFAAGLYLAMLGGFAIFHFADDHDADVVAIESISSTQFFDTPEKVAESREAMQDLQNYWLSRTESKKFIERLRSDLTRGAGT